MCMCVSIPYSGLTNEYISANEKNNTQIDIKDIKIKKMMEE